MSTPGTSAACIKRVTVASISAGEIVLPSSRLTAGDCEALERGAMTAVIISNKKARFIDFCSLKGCENSDLPFDWTDELRTCTELWQKCSVVGRSPLRKSHGSLRFAGFFAHHPANLHAAGLAPTFDDQIKDGDEEQIKQS